MEGINPAKNAKFNIRISHLFESYKPEMNPLFLVMSLQDRDKMLFYRTWDIKPQNLQAWEETTIEYEIPAWRSNSDIVKVYLWNNGGHRVYIDDFIIAIKESRE